MKIIYSLSIALMIASGAFAQEAPQDREEREPIGIDLWAGVSPGDILDEPGFVLKFGAAVENILGSGLDFAVDEFVWTISPESSQEVEGSLIKGLDIGATPFSLGFGGNYAFSFGDESLYSGNLCGILAVTLEEIQVASAELDFIYMTDNEWEFGIAATIGVGYEFSLDERSSLSLWVDFNFDLYEEFDVGDIEGTIEYSYAVSDTLSLALSIAPTVIMEEDEATLALEPTLYARLAY